MMDTHYTTVSAGLFVRRAVRNLLRYAAFRVPGIEFQETRSVLGSTFDVKGPEHAIRALRSTLAQMETELAAVAEH